LHGSPARSDLPLPCFEVGVAPRVSVGGGTFALFVVLFRSCFGFGVDLGFNLDCVAFEHCGETGSKLLGQLVGCLADVEELFEVAVVPEFNGPALARAELHRTEVDRVRRVDQVFGKHVFDFDWDAVLVGLFLFSVLVDFEDDARGVFVLEPLVLCVFEVEVYIGGCAGFNDALERFDFEYFVRQFRCALESERKWLESVVLERNLLADLLAYPNVFEVEEVFFFRVQQVPDNMECFCFDIDWDFIFLSPAILDVSLLDVEVEFKLVLFRTAERNIHLVFVELLDYKFSRTQRELSLFSLIRDQRYFHRYLGGVLNLNLPCQ